MIAVYHHGASTALITSCTAQMLGQKVGFAKALDRQDADSTRIFFPVS